MTSSRVLSAYKFIGPHSASETMKGNPESRCLWYFQKRMERKHSSYLCYTFLLEVCSQDDKGRNIQLDVSRGRGEHMVQRHMDLAQWAVKKYKK